MDLRDEDLPHLHNITHGGLMRTVTPPDVEARLLAAGHIQRGVGGLMPTKSGYETVMKRMGK